MKPYSKAARRVYIAHKGLRHDGPEEPGQAVRRRAPEPQGRARRHGQTAWFAACDAIEEAPATAPAGRGGTTEEDTAVW